MSEFKDNFPKTYKWLNEKINISHPISIVAMAAAGAITLSLLLNYFEGFFNKYKKQGYLKCGIARQADGTRPMTLQQRKCLAIYELKARKETIMKIKEKMSLCNKTKNPSKCKNKLNDEIKKHTVKIKDIENDIKNYNITMKA